MTYESWLESDKRLLRSLCEAAKGKNGRITTWKQIGISMGRPRNACEQMWRVMKTDKKSIVREIKLVIDNRPHKQPDFTKFNLQVRD